MQVNDKIMNQLLAQPAVAKHVAKMTPDELDFFKKMLVKTKVYAKYVAELNFEKLRRKTKRGKRK